MVVWSTLSDTDVKLFMLQILDILKNCIEFLISLREAEGGSFGGVGEQA